jgi:hypothetical protein
MEIGIADSRNIEPNQTRSILFQNDIDAREWEKVIGNGASLGRIHLRGSYGGPLGRIRDEGEMEMCVDTPRLFCYSTRLSNRAKA